jgi:ferredoxin
MKIPVIELGECAGYEACVELCPRVFKKSDAGYAEVIDLSEYPEEEIEEIINNCPRHCIKWKEI